MLRAVTREVAEEVAIAAGVCIRPIPYRRVDVRTGLAEVVGVPCGSTMEAKCPPCARRARQVRRAQCREGWHRESEPVPAEATDDQRDLVVARAHLTLQREEAVHAGVDADALRDLDLAIDAVDREIQASGMVGGVSGRSGGGRSRSTRRRQDAPDLPRRVMRQTTIGRVFRAPDGKTFRPSMFVTLTLPSYGRVRGGVPVNPAAYDYGRAARDAVHFSKLVDRFVQNLRRVAGFDVQYFATVEPQKRLAPHLHIAIRGTVPRSELRQIIAATYHQVWWPSTDRVVFDGDRLPVWSAGGYVDPATGEALPTWDEALDRLGADEDAEPLHVTRFGVQFDAQGVLSGSQDADQRVRYLTKYLTKSLGDPVGDAVEGGDAARWAHVGRLVEALRYEPCAPTCANWLRFGVQPKGARAGLVPGRCRGKAHKPSHLGYAGRRVLVSRRWSGRTRGDHLRDRRAWVMEALGLGDDGGGEEPGRFVWVPVAAGDPVAGSRVLRLLREVARRQRGRAALAEAASRSRGDGTAEEVVTA
ncbi:replication initiator [Streptosporangium sp. NPDC000239]|uniref:replication initiator n=1 Tax=Streptosporangium sp. NPDC000239 TaxID=3154248 RepID=UPI00331AA3E4